jgi:signal transduction histidine kinase
MDINSLTHEIINPLNIIIGSAELLKLDDKELKNKIDKKKLLDNIIQQSKNCCNLLKTELEKNKKDCFELVDFLNKIIEDIKNNPLFEEKNLTFFFNNTIHNRRHNKIFVNIHKSYLRIILQNLLLNAVKYSPRNDNIIISISTKNKSIIIEIINTIDNYIGVDNKYVSKFECDKIIPSNNYGLSVVDKLVDQISGKWYFNQQEKYIITNLICPLC